MNKQQLDREIKLQMIMEYHDVSKIVAECILDAMEEAKAERKTEYNRIRNVLDECYPDDNKTVH
tara:strand:- start:434 stop:625 length:192 start_codon:yes stop_codon:yes gene_type:complete